MKRIVAAAIVVIAAGQAAYAGSASGNSALALAALVSERSPLVAPPEKFLLQQYLSGRADAPHRRGAAIAVVADSVQCRASNVDITAHSCDLTFRGVHVRFDGRAAHELYATLAGAGVEPDGAAGSIYEAVTNLNCRITPDEVAARAGGGAQCRFR